MTVSKHIAKSWRELHSKQNVATIELAAILLSQVLPGSADRFEILLPLYAASIPTPTDCKKWYHTEHDDFSLELALISTPEMWSPLHSGHFKISRLEGVDSALWSPIHLMQETKFCLYRGVSSSIGRTEVSLFGAGLYEGFHCIRIMWPSSSTLVLYAGLMITARHTNSQNYFVRTNWLVKNGAKKYWCLAT